MPGTVLFRAFLIVSLAITAVHCRNGIAQQDQSADQLQSLLASIPPYRPVYSAKETVQVFGSSAMDALAHGWAKGFARFHPGADLKIHGMSSEQAFAQLLKSPSGVAMLSRPVKASELAELKKKGLQNPVAFPIAREALAVFVHESNPATTISAKQLKTVFTLSQESPKLNWGIVDTGSSLARQPIHMISRTQRCGTQQYLKNFVFHASKMQTAVSEHSSNSEVLAAVSKDPLAIAICGTRSQGQHVKRLHLTSAGQAIASDDGAILAGRYPLTRPLTLVIDVARHDAQALTSHELVRFALGQTGQTQTILNGFFPVELPVMRAGIANLNDQQYR